MSIVVGHVPLEISKYCYHFIRHGGEIEGKVEDIRPRRSPIPSGGLEVKLNLTFTAEGAIMHMMRQFRGTTRGAGVPVQQDDEEEYNFLNSIIFESRLMKFVLLFVKKLILFAKKVTKFSKKLT
jgi:hypothetical protein